MELLNVSANNLNAFRAAVLALRFRRKLLVQLSDTFPNCLKPWLFKCTARDEIVQGIPVGFVDNLLKLFANKVW